MPAFQYKAIDTNGKTEQGVLEADSARQIRQQLREKSLLPIEVNPIVKQNSTKRFWTKKRQCVRFGVNYSAIIGTFGIGNSD